MPNNKNNAARKAKRAKMNLLKAAVNRKSVSQGSSSSSVTQEAKAPSMMSNAIQMAPTSFSKRMAFSSSKSNSMRSIFKREFICSIDGSQNFTVVSRYINPGLKESFPWLHKIAADWQQYRFKSFRAIYITRSGAQTSGSLILSPEYNVNEGEPANEQEAVDTQDAVEDVCWKEVCSELDPSAMFGIGPRKQIRRNHISADLATYDAAILSVCTVGMTSTAQVGKLYFEYEVEFYVPQSTQLSLPLQNRVSLLEIVTMPVNSSAEVSFDVVFADNPLGLSQSAPGGPISFPVGQYRVDYIPTVSCAGGEDFYLQTRLKQDNVTFTPYVTSSGRTDTFGGYVVQNYTYLIASDGSKQVLFLLMPIDSNAQQFTLSPSSTGRIIVTLL